MHPDIEPGPPAVPVTPAAAPAAPTLHEQRLAAQRACALELQEVCSRHGMQITARVEVRRLVDGGLLADAIWGITPVS